MGRPQRVPVSPPRWRLDTCSQLQHRQARVSSFIPSPSSPFPAWCLSSDGVDRCPECGEKKSRTKSSNWMVTGPKDLPATIATQDCQHCASLFSWLCPNPCHPEKSAGAAAPTGKKGFPVKEFPVLFQWHLLCSSSLLYPNAEQTIGTRKIYKPKCQKFYLLNFFFYPLSS